MPSQSVKDSKTAHLHILQRKCADYIDRKHILLRLLFYDHRCYDNHRQYRDRAVCADVSRANRHKRAGFNTMSNT